MENLNFLPSEVMQVEEVQKIEKEEGGETKVKEIITSRKLLMPEIRKQLDYFTTPIDTFIT